MGGAYLLPPHAPQQKRYKPRLGVTLKGIAGDTWYGCSALCGRAPVSQQTPMVLPLRRLIVNCGSDSGVLTTCGDTAASVKEDDVTLSSLPMCKFEALTAIAAGHRTLEPSSEEMLRIQSPPMVPHLTASGTAFGGQTVAQYVRYGEDH
jgi:hypothetical protein